MVSKENPKEPGVNQDNSIEQHRTMFSPANVFRDYLSPVFRRPDFIQAAALCLREGKAGKEVLLITTLTSHRWILPKGWPMEGRSLGEAALQEAWEEAGVVGKLHDEAIGQFTYRKLVKQGIPVGCTCQVFQVDVDHLADDWPEKGRRERRWVTPEEAAELVEEPDLAELLSQI